MSYKQDLLNLKNKISQEYIEKYGLTGVGIGNKISGGIIVAQQSIVFFVKKKLPISEISAGQMLPLKLEGFNCDVVEIGEVKASQWYSYKIRPAVPGISLGHYLITAGTFGSVVYKGDQKYILSNNHVLANENECVLGDPIYQPGPCDGGKPADTIAYLDSFIPLANGINADCALAKITDNSLVSDLGIDGFLADRWGDPEVGQRIYKTGRSSGPTSGLVVYTHADTYCTYRTGVFLIKDCFFTQVMIYGGDSGSLGRFNKNTAAGLAFASSISFSCFNYISNVVAALGFNFQPRSAIITPGHTVHIQPGHTTIIKK